MPLEKLVESVNEMRNIFYVTQVMNNEVKTKWHFSLIITCGKGRNNLDYVLLYPDYQTYYHTLFCFNTLLGTSTKGYKSCNFFSINR